MNQIMGAPQKPIIEKKHRLSEEIYDGCVTISFTLCVKHRRALFVESEIVDEFVRVLTDVTRQYGCEIIVYVFMPDHLHIILQGTDERAKALNAMKAFKQKTGFWLSKNVPDVSWQKDYYDHILRTDDDVRKHVWYILNNPVRAGLTENWMHFDFKGSTIHDFNIW